MSEINIQSISQYATPTIATTHSAGIDLRSISTVYIPEQSSSLIRTGFAVEIPQGYVGIIMSRSGLALNNSVVCFPGVIDSDFRGEIRVLVYNFSHTSGYTVSIRDHIAQMIIVKTLDTPITMREQRQLSGSERGANGFGSSDAVRMQL